MDETSKLSPPSWPLWPPRKWVALIVCGLVLGEASWIMIASLTRDVILPLLAMAMGADNSSPLSLGKQEFNWPDLFAAVLELCLAGLFVVILNGWIQRRPKPLKVKSLSLKPAMPQTSGPPLKAAAAAQASVPAPSKPRADDRPPAASQVSPKTSSAPALPDSAQPVTIAPHKPPTPAAPAPAPKTAATKPASKKPREVYYNIVGERITPLEDETADE